MGSDEERRKVASELREMSEDDSFAAEVFCRNDSYDALVLRAIRAVVGKDEIFGVLADLIDRPTTTLTEDEDGRTCCANCGCAALYMSDATYCPDCGAEVVEGD